MKTVTLIALIQTLCSHSASQNRCEIIISRCVDNIVRTSPYLKDVKPENAKAKALLVCAEAGKLIQIQRK